MRCEKHRDALIALARGEGNARDRDEARAHLDACASCRQQFADQAALTAALRSLAEASRHEQPSDALGTRLMARFDDERAHAAAPTAGWPGTRLRWWPAAAAAVLAVGVAAWWLATGPSRPSPPVPAGPASRVIVLTGFQPLPQAAALPDFESGEIVRTQIAVAALPVYGVGIPPDAAAASVTVDFLVGQDGQPRMIRLAAEESQDARSR
jgi:anti-sigma factor ChrR (cupin superfamily)